MLKIIRLLQFYLGWKRPTIALPMRISKQDHDLWYPQCHLWMQRGNKENCHQQIVSTDLTRILRYPRTDPWETPAVTSLQDETKDCNSTLWCLFDKWLESHSRRFPPIPLCLSLNKTFMPYMVKSLRNVTENHTSDLFVVERLTDVVKNIN